MKAMKLVFICSLVMLLLAACGSGNGNQSGEGDKPAATNQGSGNEGKQEGEEKPQDKVTVKYYTWANGVTWENIQKIAGNFETANPAIDVEPIQLVDNGNSTDFYKKLDIMAATGEPIDVVQFSNVDFIVERAARGVLEPLDDFLAKDKIDASKEFYVSPSYDGKMYGIQDMASPWLIALNKSALDEAGLPVPEWGWTWDDFREYAKKLTKGKGQDKQYGAYFHTWGEYVNLITYTEKPHPYLNADKSPIFGDESYKQFFELRRAMEQEDKSVKPFSDIVGAKLHYATEFLNGDAAMIPTATFILGMIADKEKYPHDFQTVFAPLPRSSEEVEIGLSYIGGNFLSVGATSEHKEESYQFIRYMAQQTDVIRDFPGSRSIDGATVTKALIGDNGNLIDEASLIATAFDGRVKTIYDANYTTGYASQLKKVIEDGFSGYILDNKSAEDAQAAMTEAAKTVIESAK
ncbi:extracellular solute-binding protein [Paenibacillus sp. LHD-117]|uniref:ABC transporter substrate-binding protein n=1 Tax=Paenibacillus sp. LHD-117 TaxID=3071412 RepID=UPI0027E15F3A|nr:extracellular solute-binding protein [Paenibacillus sp. LHD-117]MDQ6422672.1 extracellular solute-binding protein [Paenibacillus sp. LHD-117]